uniref:Transcription termination factor 3, mitochondrial n=1 Tax=Petromyzon marinus TaxID=7757 RepID=A0AAJ7X9L3_PETMA|nr:transcription termination factor 3, mitochondrial [Petromyzon marinus]
MATARCLRRVSGRFGAIVKWNGAKLSHSLTDDQQHRPMLQDTAAASAGQLAGPILPLTSLEIPVVRKLEVWDISDATKGLPSLDEVDEAGALDELTEEEALSLEVSRPLPPRADRLSVYAERSHTLRQLVLLGVELWKVERLRGAASMLLRLDFASDVQERLLFLRDVGLQDEDLGPFLTTNPFMLTQDISNLQARVHYLESCGFGRDAVAKMVRGAPFLLNFSIERLENRLGFYQSELGLNAKHVRELMIRMPKLLTRSLEPVKENLKVLQLELGFRPNEVQHMLLKVPKLLVLSKRKLVDVFTLVHATMGLPQHMLVQFPQIFNAKTIAMRERHSYLEHLGLAQYDPLQPLYVSLDRLATTSDDVFCLEVARSSPEEFHDFRKTL